MKLIYIELLYSCIILVLYRIDRKSLVFSSRAFIFKGRSFLKEERWKELKFEIVVE